MTNYNDLIKRPHGDLIKMVEERDYRLEVLQDRIEDLENDCVEIERKYIDLLHTPQSMPGGWWLGVALFAAILIPWVFFAMWVMG